MSKWLISSLSKHPTLLSLGHPRHPSLLSPRVKEGEVEMVTDLALQTDYFCHPWAKKKTNKNRKVETGVNS